MDAVGDGVLDVFELMLIAQACVDSPIRDSSLLQIAVHPRENLVPVPMSPRMPIKVETNAIKGPLHEFHVVLFPDI